MSLFDDDDTDDEFDTPAYAHTASDTKPLLSPRENPELLGHKQAEDQILAWWQAGRMPHTLILSGPKGIGKSTLAFRLARFLMNNPDGFDASGGLFGDAQPPESLYTPTTTQSFALIASGGHPDMKYIERPLDEKTGLRRDIIPVDDVRPVPDFLRKTASMGGWRIVIVDDADSMNNNAQNALLKILEEPPAKSLLVLVTHSIGALVPTIRSRARVLDMHPLSTTDFETILRRADGSLMQGDIDTLMQFAGGAPGRAIDLLEQGGIESLRGVMGLFETLPATDDATLTKTAESLSVKSTPDPLAGMLDVSAWQLGIRARAAAAQNNTRAMRHWLDTLDSLAAHRAMCENGNLDRRHLAFGALRILQTALK